MVLENGRQENVRWANVNRGNVRRKNVRSGNCPSRYYLSRKCLWGTVCHVNVRPGKFRRGNAS